jgi:hypothetical protein
MSGLLRWNNPRRPTPESPVCHVLRWLAEPGQAAGGLRPGLAGRAEQVDAFLDDLLDRVDDRPDDLDDRVLVWVGLELCFQRGAVGVAQVGVHVDFAYSDPGGLAEVVAGRAAAAVEADVAFDGVADALQQFEIELLRDRVAAVEVADRGGVGGDPGLGDERRGTLRGGEGLADLVVVDRLGVDVGAAAEVVRLRLDQGAGRLPAYSTTSRVAAMMSPSVASRLA